MMEKRVLIVFLGVIVLLLSACGPRVDRTNFDENVYVGTEALTMRFIQDVPPSISYTGTGEIYDVALEMKNRGTFPLSGTLYITGHDPAIIGGLPVGGIKFPTQGCTFPDILPRSRGNPFGGECISEFPTVLNLNTITDNYQTNLLARAVFNYATNADVNFCVDPNPNRFRTSPQSCDMVPVSPGGGQGGPVGVTRVEGSAIGRGKVLFRITIQNLGIGEVVNPTIHPSRLRPTDTGVVGYRIGVPGGGAIGANFIKGDQQFGFSSSDTSGHVYFNQPGFYFSQFFRPNDAAASNTVRLHNGQGIITEVIDYGNVENAFQTPLQIILSYGYMQSEIIPIEIVNVESYNPDDVGGRIVVDTGRGRVEVGRGGVSIGTPGGSGVQVSRI